jgi:hypothetical protein
VSFDEYLEGMRSEDRSRREREQQAAGQHREEHALLMQDVSRMSSDAAKYLREQRVKPDRGFVEVSGGSLTSSKGASFKDGWLVTRRLVLHADGSLSAMNWVTRPNASDKAHYAFEPVGSPSLVRVSRIFWKEHEWTHQSLAGFARNSQGEIVVWEGSDYSESFGMLLAKLVRKLTGETA